ncbi:MAG: M20/M25/M40 family metallo-hydrolase [Desulfobacterales bacterium]
MIDKNRLAETFQSLVSIDSVSREEGRLARVLAKSLAKLGAETRFDTAGEKVGGDTGNLVARFKGNASFPPLLLSAHMDTVEPGKGVSAVLQDGVFTSDGTTILGADDKSALAIILETLHVLKEDRIVHGPLEIVLTICEEVGLLGAKHLDYDLLTATYGYVLDATDTDGIVTRAPAANRLELVVHGKASHAGAAPEKGINAIWLTGQAIGGLSLGRVDRETTCNIGIIEGGIATNIVPDKVIVKGEVRSHDPNKLQAVTDTIVSAFQKAVDDCRVETYHEERPRLEVNIERDFPATHIPENHPVVALARQAAANLGRNMICKLSGGGADANIFFEKGIFTGVLGTGMKDVHTVNEFVAVDDMVKSVELLIEIIRLQAAG